MNILAKIESVQYRPFLCSDLPIFSLKDFENGKAFSSASFIVQLKEDNIAISHWVSAKRTRSYPFARVYNTMKYKTRVTIIPLVKDEGKDGDRDYLQWDTVSLMSLLGVYVIIAYYDKAIKSKGYRNKITSQEFDYQYLSRKLKELLLYKSDALHWNLQQLSEIDKLAKKCENSYYEKISKACKVELHKIESFRAHIREISGDVENFKTFSRALAKKAQHRESKTIQPKERVMNTKGEITIKNFLGGLYYFTVDELYVGKEKLFLIEKKHSHGKMPSIADIQDGLIKMILYTNLSTCQVNGKEYMIQPTLGLTADHFKGICASVKDLAIAKKNLSQQEFAIFAKLLKEGFVNGFSVFLMEASKENLQNKVLQTLTF